MKYNPPIQTKRAQGFTLLEVLLSLGVFAIGFVFIAAIFPVAALLQKEAADTVNARQSARNAEAIFGAITVSASTDLSHTDLGDIATDQTLHPCPEDWLDADNSNDKWTEYIRSSPSNITDYRDRKFYWVPLVRDTNAATGINADETQVYVFILQKRNGATYPKKASSAILPSADITYTANDTDDPTIPKVIGVTVSVVNNGENNTLKFAATNFNGNPSTYDSPIQIDIGEKIVDNNGTIYNVTDYDMDDNTITVDGILLPVPNTINTIWFASPGEEEGNSGTPSGKPSPTMDLIILTDAVK